MNENTKDQNLVPLGEACQINPPKPKLRGVDDDTLVTFVPMAAVDDQAGRIATPEDRTLGELRTKSYRTFAPGDVIFAKITPCMENGKSAVVPEINSGIGFGSTEFHVLRPKPGVDPRYVWHFLRQKTFRAVAREHMTSSVGHARVPSAFLESFLIPLPDAADQAELVQFLDTALASGRSARNHLAAARRAVLRFRQAVLAAACSGRLTEDWRDQNPRAQSVDLDMLRERRQAQLGRRFREPRPNSHADLAAVPDGWDNLPLGLLLTDIKYGTSKRSEYDVPGAPVLRIPNVSGERLDVSDLKFANLDTDEVESLRLRLGDLLMIRSNGSVKLVGKALPVTEEAVGMAFAGYLMRLRTDPEALDPQFLAIVLASPWLRHQIEMPARSTSGVNNINTNEVRGLLVPTPPLDEQREIVRRTSELLASTRAVLSRVETAGREIDRTSQAVLAKAFRGDLVPSVAIEPA